MGNGGGVEELRFGAGGAAAAVGEDGDCTDLPSEVASRLFVQERQNLRSPAPAQEVQDESHAIQRNRWYKGRGKRKEGGTYVCS